MMKKIVQSLLGEWGKEIRSVDAPTRSYARGLNLLKQYITPKTVIDVGVAGGTPDLYKVFPFSAYNYLLVEAHPVFQNFLNECAKHERVQVASVFCGSENGEMILHGYHDAYKSSSRELLREGFEKSEDFIVSQKRLDDICEERNVLGPYLLKIDAEGAEYDVLSGASQTLNACEAVICEISLLDRYKNGRSFADIIRIMDDAGFALFDIWAGSHQLSTKRMHQADFVFVKSDAQFRNIRCADVQE